MEYYIRLDDACEKEMYVTGTGWRIFWMNME